MTITPEIRYEAENYIRAIRNSAKHAYALRYFRYLIGTSPACANPENLSYMAAQAVRMHLDGIVK